MSDFRVHRIRLTGGTRGMRINISHVRIPEELSSPRFLRVNLGPWLTAGISNSNKVADLLPPTTSSELKIESVL